MQTWTWTPNLSLLTDQAACTLPEASNFALTATGDDLPVYAMFVEAEGFKRLLGLLEYLLGITSLVYIKRSSTCRVYNLMNTSVVSIAKSEI